MQLLREKRLVHLAASILVIALLSACGGGSGGGGGDEPQDQQQDNQQAEDAQQQQEQQEEPEQAQPDDDSADDPAEDNAANSGARDDNAAAGEASNNVYQVGEAGEVELALENGRLVLVEARPNQGWSMREVEEEDDEVELDFVRGNVTWEFEAELEDGEIQVETERDIDD